MEHASNVFPAPGEPTSSTLCPPAAATSVKAVQPGLFEATGPQVNEVMAAGIKKITATPGKGRRSVQIDSPWGGAYFGYPKNVKPVPFTIEMGKGGVATINAPGFTEANKADYQAAVNAIVKFAVTRTNEQKEFNDKEGG